jgi:hypothetical protein
MALLFQNSFCGTVVFWSCSFVQVLWMLLELLLIWPKTGKLGISFPTPSSLLSVNHRILINLNRYLPAETESLLLLSLSCNLSWFLFLVEFLLCLFINGRLVIFKELWFPDSVAMAFFHSLPDQSGALIAAAWVNNGLLVTHPHTSIWLLQLYVVGCSHFFSSIKACSLRLIPKRLLLFLQYFVSELQQQQAEQLS